MSSKLELIAAIFSAVAAICYTARAHAKSDEEHSQLRERLAALEVRVEYLGS
jgi:hypothetical protein